MMVDGVEDAGALLRRGAEQQGGLAAVGPDFHTEPAIEVPQRGVEQRLPSSAGMNPGTWSASAKIRCTALGMSLLITKI